MVLKLVDVLKLGERFATLRDGNMRTREFIKLLLGV